MPTGVYKRTDKHFQILRENGLRSLKHLRPHNFKKGFVPWNKGKPGYKLRPGTSAKMSVSSKKAWAEGRHHGGHKLSLQSRINISRGHAGQMPLNMQRPGKYGNIVRGWFDINGRRMFFRSKWEANYALYLDFLIKQKQIVKWEYEAEMFVFHKIVYGTRTYRPDFKVFNIDGSVEYHEVKGYMNPQSKIKLKRMAKYYPEVKMVLIDGQQYRALRKWAAMLKWY